MSAPVNTTRMGRLHTALCDALLEGLKGEPFVDDDGHLVMFNDKPLLVAPKAGILKEAREFLKDMGIDKEPVEAESVVPIRQIAKAANRFELDNDELLNNAAKSIT